MLAKYTYIEKPITKSYSHPIEPAEGSKPRVYFNIVIFQYFLFCRALVYSNEIGHYCLYWALATDSFDILKWYVPLTKQSLDFVV